MNIAKLRTELNNDPLGRNYGSMTHQQVVVDINTVNRSYYASVGSAELLAWSGENQRLKNIQDAATAHASDDVGNIAKVVDIMIRRDDTAFDANLPDRISMLDALISGGVLSAEDKTSLMTLATKTRSRAVELGLVGVKAKHIERARP